MAKSERELEREAASLERTASVLGSIPGVRSIFGKYLDKKERELEAQAEELEREEAEKPTLFERVGQNLAEAKAEGLMNLRAMDKKGFLQGYYERIANPQFVEGKFENVTRLGQWSAALSLLAILIVVSLAIDVAALQVVTDVFLNDSIIPSNQLPILQFIATIIGLGFFIANIWFWFLFVKTGGFGLYDF